MPDLEPGIRALPSLFTTQTATLDARVDPGSNPGTSMKIQPRRLRRGSVTKK
jgi:hypothetical protein